MTSFKISSGALALLTNMLQGVQWYKTTKDAFIAGDLVTNVFTNVDVPRTPAGAPIDGPAFKEWANVVQDLSAVVKPKHVAVCKKCVEYYVESKNVPITMYLFELMKLLGLDDGDSDA